MLEEIEVLEGEVPGDEEDEEEDEDELMELPGGLDQLEAIAEECARREDNSKLKVSLHSKAVFCCCHHPAAESDLVVSGGEDDIAYIWSSKSGEQVEKVAGWKDSVHCAAWSADGQHLALADMSGVIKVLRYPGYTEVWSFEVGDILWVSWHPLANVLFCGTADSEMWMWKIPGGDSKLFSGPGERTECGAVLADGKRAVCGYTDGSIRLFDLKSGSTLHTVPKGHGFGHLDAINSLDCHQNNNLVVSGSQDGTAKLWNPTSGKCVGTLLNDKGQQESSESSVECCLFPADRTTTLCVTGTLSGIVTIWDTPTQIARSACKVGEGVTQLLIHPLEPLVFAGTVDGAVRCLDLRSGEPVREFTGHTESILDLACSPDGSRLITASDDATCRVYDLKMT